MAIRIVKEPAEMKHRILAAAAAAILFTGIGTAMAAGPARAATASVSTAEPVGFGTQPSGTFNICLLNDKSECIGSAGPGNQVSITDGEPADFHVVNGRINGLGDQEWEFETSAGDCLRAGDGSVVKIENGACSGAADWWMVEGSASTELHSQRDGTPMLTHTNGDGQSVWYETFQSGDWYQWTPVAAS
jgi:hypothetical protein